MKKLPNLDFVRFLLASLVVLTHVHLISNSLGLPSYSNLPVFNKGHEAVYMFFVLSGFLIVKIIYTEKQNDSFSIKKFYIRRILRIFPLYYLIIFIGFVFYNFVLPKLGVFHEIDYDLLDGVLLTCFFLPNVFTVLYDGGAIIEILWSLGIEEQFYLMIAPLIYFVPKRKVFKFILSFTILYFIIFHLNVIPFLQKYNFLYFYLFFGGVISILENKKKLNFLKTNKVIPLVIVFFTIIYYTTDFFEFENQFIKNLVSCILLSLFVHTISYNNFGIEVKSKIFNYFGRISFGIYMYHIIVIYGVLFVSLKINQLKIFNDIILICLINISTFVFTILISHFSYKYFEKPFLKLKTKFR